MAKPKKQSTAGMSRAAVEASRKATMSRMPGYVTDIETQSPPVSGERVMMPKSGALSKAPIRMSSQERRAAGQAKAEREQWEATPDGKNRTMDRRDLTDGTTPLGQQYFIDNYQSPTFTDRVNRDGSPELSWPELPSSAGPRHNDVQLPGMADPDAAPRPARWEELTAEQRAQTERAAKMHGTSIDQMSKDVGAQFDQAHMRAKEHGADVPYASDFYSTGEARQRIDQSARELEIPPTIHAQMNAFTSPNTKFSQRDSRTGQTTYPNDVAASHAVLWAQMGEAPEDLTNELRRTGLAEPDDERRAQGYTTNMRKAASAMSQHIEGRAPADWVTGSGDQGPFDQSPKTGPYANSWNDTHPQFFVSDVHSGGGGMLPHLGTGKPIMKEDDGSNRMRNGRPVRDKSEREKAMGRDIPNFHAAADFAARRAMQERNIGSVREFQAAQWGEEQIIRGEQAAARGDVVGAANAPSARDVYRGAQFESPSQIPGQTSLFGMEGNEMSPAARARRRPPVDPQSHPDF